MRNRLIVCLCVLFLVSPLGSVQAALVSLDTGVIFSGEGVPTKPAPCLNATFDDGGSIGSVDLTITAPGLTGVEKIKEVHFSLSPALNPDQQVFSVPTKMIPEPATMCIFGLGALCLVKKRRASRT